MRNCNIENNKSKCPCTYETCSRKGICCECVAYHRKSGELPGCFFSPEDERTYDRSVERFIKASSGRKAIG
ncbi:MAG: DUF6485 family protein [Nitrospirota bacterium]